MITSWQEIMQRLSMHKGLILACTLVVLIWEWQAGQDMLTQLPLMLCSLIIVPEAVLDALYLRLYHRLSLLLFLTGSVLAALNAMQHGGAYLLSALLGGGMFFSMMLLIFMASRGGMGGGDLYFAAALGVVLGVKNILLAFCLTFFGGFVAAMYVYASRYVSDKERGKEIPLGPFLALGTLVTILHGDDVMRWYYAAWQAA